MTIFPPQLCFVPWRRLASGIISREEAFFLSRDAAWPQAPEAAIPSTGGIVSRNSLVVHICAFCSAAAAPLAKKIGSITIGSGLGRYGVEHTESFARHCHPRCARTNLH